MNKNKLINFTDTNGVNGDNEIMIKLNIQSSNIYDILI